MVPIFKKDSVYDPANYKPIVLLSGISKNYERLIYDHLRYYLQHTEYLNNAQYGFKQNYLYETVMQRFSKLLYEIRSSKKFCYVVALDFS